MAKALVFGTKDCAFESHHGRDFKFLAFLSGIIDEIVIEA